MFKTLLLFPIDPVIPDPGIPFAPLSSRPQLGDCLFKVSHYALLVGKHREANTGANASTAQIKLQISSALASVNGFDEAFVAQQWTSRYYDLVAVFLGPHSWALRGLPYA